MDVGTSVLFFFVYFVSGISSETVDFFTLCGSSSTYGYDRIVSDDEKLTVSMEANTWTTFGIGTETICTVVFKTTWMADDIYIKFNSFDVTDVGIEVEIESKHSLNYYLEGKYDYFSSPSIGFEDGTDTYLKITVTRSSTTDQGLSSSFDVYTDEYTSNNELTDNDDGKIWPLITIIVGSLVGGIAVIVVIVVVIVCVVCKSKTRRNRGVVMASGNPHVTTTSSVIPIYPSQAPPVGYTARPVAYPAQPGAHPVQPGMYPPNQMVAYPAGAPPSYNTLVNGDSNPPDVGKAEPSVPQ